ncbi:aspartate/glutamate racemase family protein [Acidimangrovimonas sediminis]|uniref:aspartate/glutamate racemase family protein n=1 Tax=Acidimangrovimonas sediminis TaxID=2056283 RepID=UPI000C8066A7|nr:aspartate/glutamate racemase family protein [Acidimangrovimonas sediminis]
MTRITFINPNSTRAMTDSVVAVARAALPDATITGMTNTDGPPAIQGAADGAAAVPGLLARIPEARATGAEAIVIACFDDTGLAEAQAMAGCPVLGIGQASYLMAALLGLRFSVVTSTYPSIPVIESNIREQGFAGACASVRAANLPVLEIDEGLEPARARIAEEIALARDEDRAQAVVLGCAGMSALAPDLAARTGIRLIDGVAAAAYLARAAVGFSAA